MAPNHVTKNGETDKTPPAAGPHPGFVKLGQQYTFEQKLRRSLNDNSCDPAKEDSYRTQGVQLIENIRAELQLYAASLLSFTRVGANPTSQPCENL